MNQQALAEHFRQLHHNGAILVLANAWDAGSARALELAGCPALGTTSAGIAWSLGLPDGERLTRDEMLEVVRRIARTVSIPVSADVEAGYGIEPDAVRQTVAAAIAAGAVGVNLEDAPGRDGEPLIDVELQQQRLRAARAAAEAAGIPIVINARTDVFLLGVGAAETRLEHATRRLNAYHEAGADCLFAPAVSDAATIAALVSALAGPLNIMAGPGSLPISELARLGVTRVSLGGSIALATLATVQRAGHELLTAGTYGSLKAGLSYGDIATWFPTEA